MKVLILLSMLWSFVGVAAEIPIWGKTGHRAVGAIAQQYVNKKAQRAIDKILDGRTLAYVSTYADEIKSDTAYRQYGPWHYVNFPFDTTYLEHPKSDEGDIVAAIETCIQKLKDDEIAREDAAFYLKLLVHFIGDLHQPLHIGLAEDRGGNDFQVRWFNEGTNLHTVWDTKMIEHYNMSYTELAANKVPWSKAKIASIQKGSVISWMQESRRLCEDIYMHTRKGDKLGYRYMYDYFQRLQEQLHKGGLRLASVLNDIYG
ncbi:S1/P1 nuclease [Altibacter sp. HG106]|uniref:S1/P1 nuclease n=1 Tax=Altibacter sp. HG106 TaxID=3023937 RepID=UPI0023507E0E|nr:S1/P1 nuclease [Altibacter sp. HG106]MDC7996317.1 S1/P1 nuclease [Altibacter sp. HG106]